MLIEDGVLPSNEGRGYVLRRMLRRSMRNLRLLAGAARRRGVRRPRFMHELTAVTIEAMGEQFPELRRDAAEHPHGHRRRGGGLLRHAAHRHGDLRRRGRGDQAHGAATLSGAQAFQLHDTYGFPIDLTLEMAAEQGLSVDEEGFRRLMGEQRQRAKADARAKKTGNADISAYAQLLEQAGKVTFTGYDAADGEATIVGLLADGVPVQSATPGTEVEVVLDRTPFYAEGGGQLADHGVIKTTGPGGNAEVDVTDVQTPLPGLDRAPRHGHARRDHHRVARVGGDQRRAAPGDVPQPHRDAPGAPRAARRARRVGGAGGLGERAWPAPVRLHRDRGGAGDGARARSRTR